MLLICQIKNLANEQTKTIFNPENDNRMIVIKAKEFDLAQRENVY